MGVFSQTVLLPVAYCLLPITDSSNLAPKAIAISCSSHLTKKLEKLSEWDFQPATLLQLRVRRDALTKPRGELCSLGPHFQSMVGRAIRQLEQLWEWLAERSH